MGIAGAVEDMDAMRRVSVALQREDWAEIIELARDPETTAAVSSAKVGWGGGTALHMATYCHKLEVSKALVVAGAPLTARDKEGYTPLHIAALAGAVDVAAMLLAKGADVAAHNAYGWTPLHACSVSGNVKLAEMLMAHGAELCAKAQDGRTALSVAEGKGNAAIAQFLRRTSEARQARTKRRIVLDTDDENSEAKSDGEETRKRMKLEGGARGSATHPEQDKGQASQENGKTDTRGSRAENDIVPIAARSGYPLGPSDIMKQKTFGTSSPQRVLRLTGDPPNGDGNRGAPEKRAAPRDGAQANGGRTAFPRPSGPSVKPLHARAAPGGGQSGQRWTAPDIGKLTVSHVANLLVKYVCEGHDDVTKQVFREKILRGVLTFKLTGRVLIANEPAPGELARTILLGERTVSFGHNARHVERDVLYYSITEFIRVARTLRAATPALYHHAGSATPHGHQNGNVGTGRQNHAPGPSGSPMS